MFQNASYGKKNGMWYASSNTATGGQGWSKQAASRKSSLVEAEVPPPGGGGPMPIGIHKPSSGRVIRIINNMDHTVQVKLLT